MIPEHWTPYRRPRDGELVGYLVPAGDAVVPVTLFGYPLGAPTDEAAAESVLEATGLSVLADPWYLDRGDGESVRVRIREVSPDRLVVIQDDFGVGAVAVTGSFVLEVPEQGQLTR